MSKPTTEELDEAQFGRVLHNRPQDKPPSVTVEPGDRVITKFSKAHGIVAACAGDEISVRWLSTNRVQKIRATDVDVVRPCPLCDGSGWTCK